MHMGTFTLTERGRRAMAGLERRLDHPRSIRDSSFHMEQTPFVKDEGALRRAHATFADYMPVMQHDPDFVDFVTFRLSSRVIFAVCVYGFR